MPKKILLTSSEHEVRLAVLEDSEVVELYFSRKGSQSILGNIYLGRVQNIVPGLGAAFIDIGESRNAFLYIDEVFVQKEDLDVAPETTKKIQNVLKPGQRIVVQVTKEPIRSKGARLTTFISIPGRFLVLMPYSTGVGISKKLEPKERDRLREIANKIRKQDIGIIVRTAARLVDEQLLIRDLRYLQKVWAGIERKMLLAWGPKLIYRELDLVEKALRDIYSLEFDEIIVDSKHLVNRVSSFLKRISAHDSSRITVYSGLIPLFEKYGVEDAIHEALQRKVKLKSGGYLIIDHTEALTSIDVNTGKFIGKSDLEETILKTNLEACKEIVRQLRLRDTGGLIVVDFIDMERKESREKVLKTFLENLKKDQARSQVVEISKLGLIEMTRKGTSDGIIGALCDVCPNCGGTGYVISDETTFINIQKKMREMIKNTREEAFVFGLSESAYSFLSSKRRRFMRLLEKGFKVNVFLSIDSSLKGDELRLIFKGPLGQAKMLASGRKS
ncbi:MAG: Rne/Rng family ribonuclease [Actinobacteria bacterium]|nr:Rne/Rng family ribonuclease [Actinomycetota bacterium]